MASKSFLKTTLSLAGEASTSKLTTGIITSTILLQKGFSSAVYNTLPDLTQAERLFNDWRGNAVVRDHLVPLLRRNGFASSLAPCLIYKELSLAPDERIVVDQDNKKVPWKVRDFLGRRDETVPATVHFSDKAFSVLEYRFLPDEEMSRTRSELHQFTEVFTKAYLLLKMHELDEIVGLRWIGNSHETSQEVKPTSFST